MSYRITSAAE